MIESNFYTVLSPIFGDELYPVRHPDPDGTMGSVATLYAIYLKVGGASGNTLNGDVDLVRPRMQLSIYALNYDELKVKEKAVNDAMKAANVLVSQAIDNHVDWTTVTGALPNVSVSVSTDGYEADTKRFFVHMEFYCWSYA